MIVKQTTILITGSTSGIGKATAKVLLNDGCKIIVHGRDKKSAQSICLELGKGSTTPVWGDLSNLKQVRSIAKQVSKITPTIDCLILNAGVFQPGGQLSTDGFELDFAVNYLSHLLLTHLLLKQLRATKNARVIFVSSSAYINGRIDINNLGNQYLHDPMMAYATSKQLCLMSALELSRRLSQIGICVNACNPGPTATQLLVSGMKYGWHNSRNSPIKAAHRLEWLALCSSLRDSSGHYFNGRQTPNVPKRLRDTQLLSAVYEKSMQLCKTKFLSSPSQDGLKMFKKR